LGLTVEATARRMRLLERHFPVLPDSPEMYSHWKLLVTTHNVMGVQVHDTRLVASMIAHAVTHILTSNVSDFSRYPTSTSALPTTSSSPDAVAANCARTCQGVAEGSSPVKRALFCIAFNVSGINEVMWCVSS
jgi:hypothetical protein